MSNVYKMYMFSSNMGGKEDFRVLVFAGIFVLLVGITLSFSSGGSEGLVDFVGLDSSSERLNEERFAVLGYELHDGSVLIDYYPAEYVGRSGEFFLEYSFYDGAGEVILSGVDSVEIGSSSLKERFILDIPLSEKLPDYFRTELKFSDKEGNVLETADFLSSG